MKTLYQAANAIEAHMLIDLLKQQGLIAEIQGEHLQGAVGELPASGLVRLVIDEPDYPAARSIIDEWEQAQPVDPIVTVQKPVPKLLKVFLIGAALGVALTYGMYRAPTTGSSFDHNRDGVPDEKWTYSPNGTLLKYEADRNFDKKIDMISEFGRNGLTVSGQSDDDFNGVFETKTHYEFNAPVKSEVDTNDDGVPDLVIHYKHGILVSNEILNPYTGLPLRVEYFRLGVLTHADLDTDKNGKLDKRIFYNRLGEIQRTEAITQ